MKKLALPQVLSTPYEVEEVPFSSYPRPQFRRESYHCLNGLWSLSVERKGVTTTLGEIRVPFPPESPASEIVQMTEPGDTLLYEKRVAFHPTDARTLLHFGAVDCHARVEVNGIPVGEHSGGYWPFTLDITAAVRDGENRFAVYVEDSLDMDWPYGKQCYKRGGMWYTPISGIWQTVWLECVPENAIESLRLSVTLDSVTVETRGGAPEKVLTLEGREYTYTGDSFTLSVEEPQVWTPDNPHLYPFTLKSGEDCVQSYFALREFAVGEREGEPCLLLNGEPVFCHGLLDQGYYADGIYLPGSPEGYREDILRAKALGFNMLRKHIKIEPDIFYALCDSLGMLVFQDMVNNGAYSFLRDTALPTVGFKRGGWRPLSRRAKANFQATAKETVALLHNHPSVVYYTIFNEGWGQHNASALYRELKALDPSRVWDTASGWFRVKETDVDSAHVYFRPVRYSRTKGKPLVLSEFGGYACVLPEHSYNPDKVYGYARYPDVMALTQALEGLYREQILPAIDKGLCATVLTQLTDVEDEANGLITYDRQVVKPDVARMQALADDLTAAFARKWKN